jgi:photosystem II stability/assembly factor-like uncharacterized protein
MKIFKTFFIFALVLLGFQTAEAGWRKIESGTLGWLHAVYFLNDNKGWIAGSQGTFLTTEDGGKTWRQAAKFTEDKIRDVYFSDAQTGWILCEHDRFTLGKASPSYLMKTADGGASWETIEIDKGRIRLSRLFFDKKGFGYAVGEGGIFYALQDDRRTWKKSALPVSYLMLAGTFPGEFQAALVGGGGTILFTDDAGMSWNKATLAGELNTRLNSVFFINQKIGWTVGAAGKIYTTSNGGRFWREQNSGVTKDLTDVFFLDTAEGFAVGDNGTILHTTTAGNIWNAIKPAVKHRLERIFFAGNRGFAVGFGGTILVYDSAARNS